MGATMSTAWARRVTVSPTLRVVASAHSSTCGSIWRGGVARPPTSVGTLGFGVRTTITQAAAPGGAWVVAGTAAVRVGVAVGEAGAKVVAGGALVVAGPTVAIGAVAAGPVGLTTVA